MLLPDEIVFMIATYLHNLDYFERMYNSINDICSLIVTFMDTGCTVSPQTMAILNHIMFPVLDEWNAHEFFMKNWQNVFWKGCKPLHSKSTSL